MATYLGRSGQKEGPVMQKTILLLISLWLSTTEVQAQTRFYQGKTITLIVGSGAGTAYDIYARLLGSYVGKHLLGNPTVVVQNMPAAGGMVAANFVYGVAKPDGLTLASINPAHYFNQLQGNKEVKFDWPKFTWIASSDKSGTCSTCGRTRHIRPYKTCAKRRSRPNAAPPGREPADTTSRECSKKLSARNLT